MPKPNLCTKYGSPTKCGDVRTNPHAFPYCPNRRTHFKVEITEPPTAIDTSLPMWAFWFFLGGLFLIGVVFISLSANN